MLIRYGLPVIAILALGFAVLQMAKAQQKPAPAVPPVEPAKSPFSTQLAGAGIVEPESENIAVGSHVAGIVERVYVRVGDTVRPGDPLFRLDDRHLKAELAIRESNLANSRSMLDKLKQLPRKEELPAVQAKVVEAEANLRDQEKSYDRVRKISGTPAVSDDEVTRREIAVLIAKAQLDKAKADLDLLNAGAWQPDKDVAATAVRQMQAMSEQMRTELERLTAQTPRVRWSPSGTPQDLEKTEFKVLQVNVRPGEYVGTVSGAFVVLGQVGKLHVRVDIDENDIARFGTEFSGVAKPRGNPGIEFPLKFVRVEPFVIPKKSLTGANTERVDTRVLQVIYAIDTAGKPLYVGQQVDVFLNTGDNK